MLYMVYHIWYTTKYMLLNRHNSLTMSTGKVDEVPAGEDTALSEAASAVRTVNVTNYGSVSSDPPSTEAKDDGASKAGASDGAGQHEKKERKSSVRRRSNVKGDDDAVAVGPGLDTIIQGAFIRDNK